MTPSRALIMGHFSTVGDLEVLDVVRIQLDQAKIPFDIAPYSREIMNHVDGWIDPRTADPSLYSHLFVVCGPIYRSYLFRNGFDLDRFGHCVRIAVNVTLIDPVANWNPFDVVIGRDCDAWQRCDISLLRETERVPVIGLCFVKQQKEYGERQKHDRAGDLLRRAALRSGMAVMELDTEWPGQRHRLGTSSPEQFESLCLRLDVMLTTRLHGLVLSLKNGIPVLAVDGISGGDKVSRQAKALDWPMVFGADGATDEQIDAALAFCLTQEARDLARECADRARVQLGTFPGEFRKALEAVPQARPSHTAPQP